MSAYLKRFLQDERGATAIEYGLIAALISVAVIGILSQLGGSLEATFQSINNGLSSATGG